MNGLWVLVVAPIATGLLVGRLTGGSLARIGTVRLRAMWLLWLAAFVQIVSFVTGRPLSVVVFGLVVIWLGRNVAGRPPATRIGLLGVASGLLGNGLAMAINGGRMPYLPDAEQTAGLPAGGMTAKNAPATADTTLKWLADTMAVWPGSHIVISVGDLLICLGIGVLTASLTRNPTAQRPMLVKGGDR